LIEIRGDTVAYGVQISGLSFTYSGSAIGLIAQLGVELFDGAYVEIFPTNGGKVPNMGLFPAIKGVAWNASGTIS